MSAQEIAKAIFEARARSADTATQRSFSDDKLYATWLAAEDVDPDLSHIVLTNGAEVHGVRKYSHVTGLTLGMTVVCESVGPSKNLIICGIPVGDISLYEAPE